MTTKRIDVPTVAKRMLGCEDVQIMAFILQQNGYPAGGRELVYEDAEKSTVPLRYYGK